MTLGGEKKFFIFLLKARTAVPYVQFPPAADPAEGTVQLEHALKNQRNETVRKTCQESL